MNSLEDILMLGYEPGPNALAGVVPKKEEKVFMLNGVPYSLGSASSAFEGSYAGPQYNMPLLTPQDIGRRLGRQVSPSFWEKPVDRTITPELVEKAYKVAEIGGWAGGGLPGMMAEIKAFHGSPYKFDKFSMEKIGTGKGAQTFGHGLYFTSEKDIAKHYASPNLEMLRRQYGQANSAVSDYMQGKKDLALERMDYLIESRQEYIDRFKPTNPIEKQLLKQYKDIKDKIQNDTLPVENSIYSVTLHKGKKPGEYNYLKWDEPINESLIKKIEAQAKKEGLPKELLEDIKGEYGENVYHVLADYISPKEVRKLSTDYSVNAQREASAFLLRAGIDGIEYPAGSLSGGGKGGRNYVVFDENAISIEK